MPIELYVKVGDRVELFRTTDPYTDLKPGDQGVVTDISHAFDIQTIGIRWDSGSTLSMVPASGDRVLVLPE